MGKEPDEIRSEIEQTRAQMTGTVEAIGYRADVKSRAKDSISEKKDAVVGAVTSAKDALVGTAADTSDSIASTLSEAIPDSGQARDSARRAVSVAQNNPLGLAVGGAALGFLAGIALPSSRAETRRLQPVANQIKDTATDVGEQALEHGRQVVQDTAQSALETAKESGKEHGQAMADELKETAQDAAGSKTQEGGL
jgi:hypothetical protein